MCWSVGIAGQLVHFVMLLSLYNFKLSASLSMPHNENTITFVCKYQMALFANSEYPPNVLL